MNIIKILKEINWKSLIIGSALCVFLAAFGFNEGYEFLIPFSSVGLLYIGYSAKNLILGIVLGVIGSIPLGILAITGGLGAITGNISTIVITLIACLVVGGILGVVGAYFHKNRTEKIEKKEKIGKTKKNK